ncbi:MAG: hypothetical protein HYS87_00945 [Candidatus Colwellbacteria bacterium]|nr:hypothetical protein [Candidatus Colwellbacteria bacterium]
MAKKVSFKRNQSLREFQRINGEIYNENDDRLYSLPDIMANQLRFTMRAIKGVRKKNKSRLENNLLIAFSWLMTLASRLHIDVEDSIWKRFPGYCPYCGGCPCKCRFRKVKPKKMVRLVRKDSKRPKSLAEFQEMVESIYPQGEKTLIDSTIHLAEEAGEVSEAIQIYYGEHKDSQFKDVAKEIADFACHFFNVASAAGIDIARGLAKQYKNNCHVCHKAPCICKFSYVAKFKS